MLDPSFGVVQKHRSEETSKVHTSGNGDETDRPKLQATEWVRAAGQASAVIGPVAEWQVLARKWGLAAGRLSGDCREDV